jgi:ketosteroid isomerase-like protein
MAREAEVIARTESVVSEVLGGPLVDGDRVAIRWRFGFVFKDGRRMQQEEVAWQTWRGEKIATETFFYDPAQRNAG